MVARHSNCPKGLSCLRSDIFDLILDKRDIVETFALDIHMNFWIPSLGRPYLNLQYAYSICYSFGLLANGSIFEISKTCVLHVKQHKITERTEKIDLDLHLIFKKNHFRQSQLFLSVVVVIGSIVSLLSFQIMPMSLENLHYHVRICSTRIYKLGLDYPL